MKSPIHIKKLKSEINYTEHVMFLFMFLYLLACIEAGSFISPKYLFKFKFVVYLEFLTS